MFMWFEYGGCWFEGCFPYFFLLSEAPVYWSDDVFTRVTFGSSLIGITGWSRTLIVKYGGCQCCVWWRCFYRFFLLPTSMLRFSEIDYAKKDYICIRMHHIGKNIIRDLKEWYLTFLVFHYISVRFFYIFGSN